MENLEEMFIPAEVAKTKTENSFQKREEINREKAINFLKECNFNKIIEEACEKSYYYIQNLQVGSDISLAYAVKELLHSLGYKAEVFSKRKPYEIYINWGR